MPVFSQIKLSFYEIKIIPILAYEYHNIDEYNWGFLMFVLCFCNEGINKIFKNMAQKNNLMKKGV